MKTPLSYYGGKQQLVSKILSIIPSHRLYCEPFLGGGAVFFAKPQSDSEVINDTNRELINFYEIIQNDFVSLEKEVQISLHSRDLHRKATVIYNNPDMFTKLKRAWAVWILANESYSSMLNGTFGYDLTGQTARKVMNKRDGFTLDYAIRLQGVEIECTDALRIIRSRDSEDSFFYCDPPYINTDCGHYDGYSVEDYMMLLNVLEKIEGKFLLSSFPNEVLDKYLPKNDWCTKQIEMNMSVNAKSENRKKTKTEVFTANYDLNMGQGELF
ncbi:MAG: DNA adenine methylase [Spirochaetia bacterium]|nr:DNA adenine methylase [Spirochaetia bacterium]